MGNEWKCVLVLSARLIEAYDDIVVLECLIDEAIDFPKLDFVKLFINSRFFKK